MIEVYLDLLIFVILMVATPGPANLLVMIGGAQVGVRPCLGFIAGLVGGKIALNICFGVGLGLFLMDQPLVLQILKYVSAAYMIWLTVQSWNDSGSGDAKTHVFGFRRGIIVHPLNPKAWVMVLLAWTQFAPELGSFGARIILVTLTFAACQILFHTLWCWAGAALQRAVPKTQILTRSLIILTLAVVVWALFQ
ncbi:LysE family transporter [Alphaproteobacteria bacterium]|jgi:threonine/homoserine/homoserine lactone efflux protein|nr:LysE family transporter [Alphaproteobacteria bacterium]